MLKQFQLNILVHYSRMINPKLQVILDDFASHFCVVDYNFFKCCNIQIFPSWTWQMSSIWIYSCWHIPIFAFWNWPNGIKLNIINTVWKIFFFCFLSIMKKSCTSWKSYFHTLYAYHIIEVITKWIYLSK